MYFFSLSHYFRQRSLIYVYFYQIFRNAKSFPTITPRRCGFRLNYTYITLVIRLFDVTNENQSRNILCT